MRPPKSTNQAAWNAYLLKVGLGVNAGTCRDMATLKKRQAQKDARRKYRKNKDAPKRKEGDPRSSRPSALYASAVSGPLTHRTPITGPHSNVDKPEAETTAQTSNPDDLAPTSGCPSAGSMEVTEAGAWPHRNG